MKNISKSSPSPILTVTLNDALSDRSGMPIDDRIKIVAQHFGVAESTVRNYVLWLGITAAVNMLRKRVSYDSINKIAGLSPFEGENEAIGFTKQGKLVHLKGETITEISLKQSVRVFREMDERFCNEENEGLRFDWSEDNDAKSQWLRMLEKALED